MLSCLIGVCGNQLLYVLLVQFVVGVLLVLPDHIGDKVRFGLEIVREAAEKQIISVRQFPRDNNPRGENISLYIIYSACSFCNRKFAIFTQMFDEIAGIMPTEEVEGNVRRDIGAPVPKGFEVKTDIGPGELVIASDGDARADAFDFEQIPFFEIGRKAFMDRSIELFADDEQIQPKIRVPKNLLTLIGKQVGILLKIDLDGIGSGEVPIDAFRHRSKSFQQHIWEFR